MPNLALNTQKYQKLTQEISQIIKQAKEEIQKNTTALMAQAYWKIGKKINSQNLSKNANYANLISSQIAKDLEIEASILRRAVKLYETYPRGISEKLSWTHYRQLITVKNPDTRKQLEQNSIKEKWTTAQLKQQITTKPTSTTTIKRPTNPSYLYKAKIIDVVDGDTLILNIDLGFQVIKEQRVRLAKIDAAEIKSDKGQKAFNYLRDLCVNLNQIVVKTNKSDIYGRFIVDVFYLNQEHKKHFTHFDYFEKGVYLNQELLEKDLVQSY